jgi:hypothetical protein
MARTHFHAAVSKILNTLLQAQNETVIAGPLFQLAA